MVTCIMELTVWNYTEYLESSGSTILKLLIIKHTRFKTTFMSNLLNSKRKIQRKIKNKEKKVVLYDLLIVGMRIDSI